MFAFKNQVITKVFNPLNITSESFIEFDIEQLKDTGMYRFNLIIEVTIGDFTFSRYIIYSKSEETEYVIEAFPTNNDQIETRIYNLEDSIPFSEEFLQIVGQRYLTNPEGEEYERVTMPENENRIDGVEAKIRIYNINASKVEKQYSVKIWEYQRQTENTCELMNIEMSQEDGMFKIFSGEVIENIFYKLYQNLK